MKSAINTGGYDVLIEHLETPQYELVKGHGKQPIYQDQVKGIALHKMCVIGIELFHRLPDDTYVRISLPTESIRVIHEEIDRLKLLPVAPREIDY